MGVGFNPMPVNTPRENAVKNIKCSKYDGDNIITEIIVFIFVCGSREGIVYLFLSSLLWSKRSS